MYILDFQDFALRNEGCRDWLQSSKFGPLLEQEEVICTPEGIEIHCRSEANCTFLLWKARYLLSEVKQLGYQQFSLFHLGSRILMSKDITPEASMPYNVNRDMEIIEKLFHSERSGALVSNLYQTMILANQHISSTAGKPPSAIAGQDMNKMWPSDTLEKLLNQLNRDKILTEYEYHAYGWQQLESGVWLRKLKKFCGDFELVTFQGKPCRLSSVVTL